MKSTRFNVGEFYTGTGLQKKRIKFIVTDTSVWDKNALGYRQPVAEFPISASYDDASQMARAEAYCEYMNKVAAAIDIAYEQNQLVDILKR